MVRSKQAKKKPSRVAYEESHPTISFRLDIETHDRLKEHLKETGCSFAVFVKDALGREKTMVEERVTKLASRKIKENEAPARDLELYDIVAQGSCQGCSRARRRKANKTRQTCLHRGGV